MQVDVIIKLLSVCGIVVVALALVPRFLGRRQEKASKQYDVLEKRFGLTRRVTHSRWGKGIGERFSLDGQSRGYPLSLYDHFSKKENVRHEWTSLVFEALFAGEVEFCIEFPGTQEGSRFSSGDWPINDAAQAGVDISASESLGKIFLEEGTAKRLEFFAGQPVCGTIRLSKGFLEYRETGLMEDEKTRLRFQEAILLLADVCDSLSLYISERKVACAKSGA